MDVILNHHLQAELAMMKHADDQQNQQHWIVMCADPGFDGRQIGAGQGDGVEDEPQDQRDQCKAGQPSFKATRRRNAEHDIEKVGEKLRDMMPWIKANQLVDKDKN